MIEHRSLGDIVSSARTDIKLIREFLLEGDTHLTTKVPRRAEIPFTPEEVRQLDNVVEMFASLKPPKTGVTRATARVSDRVSKFLMDIGGSVKQRSFFAEMALIYLETRFEAFIKDYLLNILLSNPKMLRSGATITFEQALSYKSAASLRRGLAEREVEALGYGSIDDLAAQVEKRFGLSFSKFSEWQAIREYSYRRNLVVHTGGRINEIYRKKMAYKGTDKRLNVDMDYVATAALTVLSFIDFIHTKVPSNEDRRKRN